LRAISVSGEIFPKFAAPNYQMGTSFQRLSPVASKLLNLLTPLTPLSTRTNGTHGAIRQMLGGVMTASVAIPECANPVRPAIRESRTILVVEDETFVCEVTCDLLQHHGYRVLHAETAAEARKVFFGHIEQIDLLLCDAVLPDENGLSLAHSLRQRSPKLKLIFASGYPRSELDDDIDNEPGAQFLTKPFSSSALMAKIRILLDEKIAA
jgi:CheY-like chemotaxis protein